MSETMTRIRLPGTRIALLEWGEKSHADMVGIMRSHYEHRIGEARTALDAADDAFEVDVVRGPFVQHHIRKVLPT